MPLKYKNTWRIGFGMEYSLRDWLDLRCGYAWEQTPTNKLYPSYSAPNGNSHTVSLGAGMRFGRCTLDLAYAYVHSNPRTTRGGNGERIRSSPGRAHIISTSVGFKF